MNTEKFKCGGRNDCSLPNCLIEVEARENKYDPHESPPVLCPYNGKTVEWLEIAADVGDKHEEDQDKDYITDLDEKEIREQCKVLDIETNKVCSKDGEYCNAYKDRDKAGNSLLCRYLG